MAKLLAIEWDAREARVVVGRPRGASVVVEQAFAVELPGGEKGQVGEALATALGARQLGKCDTLVAVGRASIELKQLSLPDAPPDELPDMVRFQAMRQFTNLGDDWPLDFVPLGKVDDSLAVIAATISPELIQQIRETCQTAALSPKRLILRPFAAASLLRQASPGGAPGCRLLIDMLADEADLTVLADDAVMLMRTVRLPTVDDAESLARAFLGEIRRTIAAAHNQLRGRRIEQVVVCEDQDELTALKSLIETQLGLPVHSFDPFREIELEGPRPPHAGRYAPLLGMLCDEAAATPHGIDFLHPRRRPEQPDTRRRNVLIAATIATAACAAAFLVWFQLDQFDSSLDELRARSKQLDRKLVAANESQRRWDQLQQFLDGDIDWLRELDRLNAELPAEDTFAVTRLLASLRPVGGGQIELDGYAQASEDIVGLRQALIQAGREIDSAGNQEDARRKGFRWHFNEKVFVASASAAPPVAQPGPPAAAGAPANTTTPVKAAAAPTSEAAP